MALSADIGARGFEILRSPPCEFWWGPWRAMSYDLERDGWRFSVYQDPRNDPFREQVTVAMHHGPSGMAGLATCPQQDLMSAVHISGKYGGNSCDKPIFMVRRMGMDSRVHLERNMAAFSQISMEPEIVNVQRFTLRDLFAQRLQPKEEIIVEPQTVSSLLEQIKKLQSPELAAIRERNRWRDETRHLQDQPAPEWREEAPLQIVTLRKAA